MWIHFSKSSYGTYGGGFKEPFVYFGRIISDTFKKENIEFPFEEIEIQLALFSPKAKKEETYVEWYKKLPYYYRGKKMIRVILPVEKQEDNLTNIFLLIHKAFEIIVSKKKKDDMYDADNVKSALIMLEEELKVSDLWEVNSMYQKLIQQEVIKKNIQDREERRNANNEKKRLIRDIRFMYHLPNTERLHFAPYDKEFCDTIFDKLREKKFRLPGYDHLYIMVSDSLDNALEYTTRILNWYVYGVAVLENHADYPTKTEQEKKQIVFDLIKQGLNDIAEIDKLDKKTLNEVLDEVEKSIN